MARIPLSDKASPQECQAVDELLGYVDLKNTTRGSSRVFQKECLEHDEVGLSSIFDKILNDDIKQLKPSEIPPTAPRYEPNMSRTPSMESLCERKLSRTSSMDSLDTMVMEEFDKFPVYCM